MRTPEERIVVTGMGVITPLGPDVESTWLAIARGNHALRDIRSTVLKQYSQFDTAVGGPILDFDLFKGVFSEAEVDSIEPKDLRRIHRSAQFALWAGAEALLQAGVITKDLRIDPSQINPDHFGLRIGTSIGGGDEIGRVRVGIDSGKTMRPPDILQILPERVATVASMTFNARGPTATVISACATGNANIIAAEEKLRLGRAEAMLAGGTDAVLSPIGISIFEGAGAVDKTHYPDLASRPFHDAKAGLVMGEGAGLLVMETLESARRRGAIVLAELLGVSETSDAHHETLPSGEGAVRAMREAISGADIQPSDKVYINAHATGTMGDSIELEAISEIFNGQAVDGRTYYPEQVVGISSTKGATGHLLGAAGAVESVISIKALQEGIVPPSLKLDSPIEQARSWPMSPMNFTKIDGGIDFAINNSFGFGGLNAVTIWGKPR
jgi:3-oxoacyl-[acyl-carrier-protein] synthase II